MEKELKQMGDLGVWTEVEPHEVAKGSTVMPFAEQFKVKSDANGEIEKCKCRFCANGSKQEKGKDHAEAHAPVVDPVVFRWLLCVATAMGMKTRQFDFSGAFLNSVLPSG
ncbi:MAG: hypothetical protein AAGM67_21880, partial [Bacteroidota bacterium]